MDVLTLALAKKYTDAKIGEPGRDGATWYHGEGSPEADLGKNQDYYLNTLTSDVYKKEEEVWSVIGNIKGEDGSTIGNYDGGHPASVYGNLKTDGGEV